MKSGRIGMRIDAAGADLPHQVHAHGIAAEREEGAMAQREDAAISPDQVDRERQQRVADVFAEQRDEVAGHMQRRARREREIEDRHHNGDQQDHRKDNHSRAAQRTIGESVHHASTALPFSANKSARPLLDEEDEQHQNE